MQTTTGVAPLGAAPRGPQADTRTVDLSGPGDAATRELIAVLTPPPDDAGAQEAIDRGRPLLSSAARAMAALSSEFRAFAMLVASQNALTELQIGAAVQGWRNSLLFAWANDAARDAALAQARAAEAVTMGNDLELFRALDVSVRKHRRSCGNRYDKAAEYKSYVMQAVVACNGGNDYERHRS